MNILRYDFMQNALLAGLIVSVICGALGPLIVARRMVFVTDGISHTAFGGLGIAYWMASLWGLSFSPLWGALIWALLAAVGIAVFQRERKQTNDLIIGIIWVLGMAIGAIFIRFTPGYAPDLMTFLFGSILLISRHTIYFIAALGALIVACVTVFHRGFVAISSDEEFARVRGVPVRFLNLLLLLLTALAIITMLYAVGVILVIALVTIPVAMGMELVHDFKGLQWLSGLFSLVLVAIGLYLSYAINMPTGASIVVVGAFMLGLVKLIKFVLTSKAVPAPAPATAEEALKP